MEQYSLLRDLTRDLPEDADAVQLYWHEARHYAWQAMQMARAIWDYRDSVGNETGKTDFELNKHLETDPIYKSMIGDEQFFERLTNMFSGLTTAGVGMEQRDGKRYTLAHKPRRAENCEGQGHRADLQHANLRGVRSR